MAGALDKAFRDAAKAIVVDLGSDLNTEIDYVRKFDGEYDTAKGAFSTFDRPYRNLKCPIEFIQADPDENREERRARVYVAPEQIGGNQPSLQDEMVIKYAGSDRTAQVIDVRTYRGGQAYLYIVEVRF